MNIHEVGIIIGGIQIVYRNYDEGEEEHTKDNPDIVCKSALMSSILNFAETLISPMSSFESNKYNVSFRKSTIDSNNSEGLDLFAYLISDKENLPLLFI